LGIQLWGSRQLNLFNYRSLSFEVIGQKDTQVSLLRLDEPGPSLGCRLVKGKIKCPRFLHGNSKVGKSSVERFKKQEKQ
jgi:hypothetical protein